MTFFTPRYILSSFSISSLLISGFRFGFSKHSSVVMQVPVKETEKMIIKNGSKNKKKDLIPSLLGLK